MRITYKGDYALKTLLDLAVNYGSNPISISELAKRADIPIKFLEQILLELKKGGFVESRRGKIGGYLLSRHPAKITLGEVIRFIDGPIEPIACVRDGYKGCSDLEGCVFKKIWSEISECTSSIIGRVNFEDLAKKSNKPKEEFIYQI
ncbi:MAG: transcriptional regulator [Candidatus Omnitrophica bacterium CG08_land_8_20_14_0_20_41_16]|uniref:Transcriptional regulator n=1 Tax=Candidatus Sherwoodlollariibacterium unditelluris TaxID=1974757 RepID=A0A2G9YLC8_9BACT|nr:MAG: transcriptional regulator [Candidatus Omnitrophica bacterium CG23_combo_of_CG06-09_8_20_14_all_41_10]PIS33998.1 MAG: transcriptional regulator [Candidatus Omnitrophica bacterium CG08_land_8_20_14_0_20_41_16]